jgi:hypothetical protein
MRGWATRRHFGQKNAPSRERDAALVYGEEKDLFRRTDPRFAFSREHADWELLRKRGRIRGW